MFKRWVFVAGVVILGGVGFMVMQKSKADEVATSCLYRVGKYKLISLLDGYNNIPLQSIIKDDLNFDDPFFHQAQDTTIKVPINVFLLDQGKQRILFDVGLAGMFDSQTGKMLPALAAAGYRPDQITAVCITHFHPDHIAGLLLPDGSKAFKNAELYINQGEADFWKNSTDPLLHPRYTQIDDLMEKIFKVYSVHYVVPGQEFLDGVTAVATQGHTPGHISFLCKAGKENILVWGDLLHFPQIQFAHPDIGFTSDSDRQQAIAARKAMLQQAAENSWIIAGVHLALPGVGKIELVKNATQGQPSYQWIAMNPIC